MSDDYITLNFLDGQSTEEMEVNKNSLIKDVLKDYLKKIKAYETLDMNVYGFKFGITFLNKESNLKKTVDELGLDDGYTIRLTRKKDRNYAKDKC